MLPKQKREYKIVYNKYIHVCMCVHIKYLHVFMKNVYLYLNYWEAIQNVVGSLRAIRLQLIFILFISVFLKDFYILKNTFLKLASETIRGLTHYG